MYRVIDGWIWKWESDGDFIRMTRLCELYYDGEPVKIENFAENLIEQIQRESKEIIINL